jgi:ABC-2 type transport system ATP-binding protein
MTVLLTTHYLDEADRLASRLAIVDHGRVVAHGSPNELKDGLRGDAVIVELAPNARTELALSALTNVAGVRELTADDRTVRARADAGGAALPRVLAALEDAALPVASATVARPSLDDVYLQHTGRAFAAGQPTISEENAA